MIKDFDNWLNESGWRDWEEVKASEAVELFKADHPDTKKVYSKTVDNWFMDSTKHKIEGYPSDRKEEEIKQILYKIGYKNIKI